MRLFAFVFYLLLAAVLPLSASESQEPHKKTFVLTLPKSGTFLFKKILPMIMEKDPDILYYTNIDQDPFHPPYIPESQFFIFNHVYPGFDIYKGEPPEKLIKVILIRDPRDAVVSFMNWIQKVQEWGPWTPKDFLDRINNLPVDERLLRCILFPDAYLGLHLFCQKALEWMEEPGIFVCRFEDIVGPQGGGNRLKQEQTIKALSEHLGYPLTPKRIAYIADHLFGDTPTFHLGKIGAWKTHFNENHKILFKCTMGKELIKMGYVDNDSW